MALSPTKTLSSPKKNPKKDVTRYGKVKKPEAIFGSEERFQWQNSKNTNDVAYDLPEMKMSRSIMFGQSLRKGMDEENPDNKKRSVGPGSYEYRDCYDHLSEYVTKEANRFACAPRQSMAMKTPSPGAVYNIEKKYYTGPEKSMGIGFPNSSRDGLFKKSLTMNADMFIPKPETGNGVTIAGKLAIKNYLSSSPGPIYDVHVRNISSALFVNLFNHFSCKQNRKKLIFVQVQHIHLGEEKGIDLKRLGFCLNRKSD